MRARQIVLRSLTYYWRTNVAVVLGVATAVAVLAGALLVGDSVRGSLRDLLLGRLGRTDHVIASANLFREQLAQDLAATAEFKAGFAAAAPLVIAQGMITAQNEGRRIAQARVYGVDNRFWRFHDVSGVSGPNDREAFISAELARQLGANRGEPILVRVPRPTDIPLDSLHGQRDSVGQSVRLTIANILPAESLGEFSLEALQGDVSAVFVPLSRLQQDLDIAGRVNTILVSTGLSPPADAAAALRALVRSQARLEDLGYLVETADTAGVLVVGSAAGVLDDAHAGAAMDALDGTTMQASALFTYLANSIRLGEREVPYSLVTALDLATIEPISQPASAEPNSIVLNDWAARELQARSGDVVSMEYYAWEEPGRLVTKTTTLTVSGVVPIDRGDRNMVPAYPGITDSPTLDDWNPPFPVDLRRIRKVDEEYWERYRTTPKAFVSLETGQSLWQTRHGSMTSIRVRPEARQPLAAARELYTQRLRAAADPLALGITVIDVRQQGLEASRGATDFGEYFVYFSFFIVVSALLLVALFFKLGIEQRVREVGLLRAVGLGPAAVRRLFLQEGVLLAAIGSVLGAVGAIGYAWLMMFGLRSWWVDAVGTTALTLHVSPASIAGGVAGGIVAAIACIWWTLRALGGVSERSLLMGTIENSQLSNSQLPNSGSWVPAAVRQWRPIAAATLALVAALLIVGAMTGTVARVGAFFGAGSALLMASLCAAAWWLRHRARSGIYGHGWLSVSKLGMRTATYRPGRSVLSIAVIAAATFILVSVEAFRRGDQLTDTGAQSGVGGFDLVIETLLPVVQDPNTREGREALNLFDLDESVTFEPLRLLPGDDASCLNLYEPRSPRIVAARRSFLREGRFAFHSSLAETEAERTNPWLLLERAEADGVVPVIADANSMAYVLHKQLGDEIVLPRGDGEIRLRLVAALRDSIFQGELLMAEESFLKLFPEQDGFRVVLVRAGQEPVARLETTLEDGFADLGAQVVGTAERLARFHRVENTYLSTFQTLGGLGLLLGTFGLATVLLRNVLERKRELALLGAVGYRRAHVMAMVVAENVLLLVTGLTAGAFSAALAIAPAVAERGSRLPFTSGSALLMIAVLITGLLSSVIAMRAATRMPLLASLRSE
jgi:ABC-type lipoprotein release transport system permease subunit